MLNSRSSETEGAAAVELAILLPLLSLIIFGIIEFGLAYNRQQSIHAASREAARLAAVGFDAAAVQTAARNQASNTMDRDDIEVDIVTVSPTGEVTGLDGNHCSDLSGAGPVSVSVRVRVAAGATDRYGIRIPFGPQSSPDYAAVATFRCEVER